MIYSVFIVTILLIAGIVTLITLSNIQHGFNVNNSSVTKAHIEWKLSFVWVVIPALIFITYGLCMGSIVDAFIFRQPFIELVRGAPIQKSLALDYQAYFPIKREYKMVRNGHLHLAPPSLLSLCLKAVIGALSARLLVEGSYTGSEPKTLEQTHALSSSTRLDEPLGWDLVPVLGITSATQVYGANYPRWSDGDRTFLNFTSTLDKTQASSQPRLTVHTPAYFARLDCQIMQDVQQHLRVVPDKTADPGRGGHYYLNGTDNDCEWTTIFAVTSGFQTYMQTSSTVDCSTYGDSSFSGRLIIISGQIASLNDSNLTIASCVPTYWTSMNRLTMDLDRNALHPIISFEEDVASRKELRPQWWNSFESQLQQVQTVDTTVSGGISGASTTTMGRIILDKLQRNSADPLDPDALIRVVKEVYATTYAILIDTFKIRPAIDSTELEGSLETTHDRLFIVNAVAGVILAFLVASALTLVVVFLYTRNPKHCSGLYEEPTGVIGYAAVSHGRVVNDLLTRARQAEGFSGKAATDVIESLKVDRPSPPAGTKKWSARKVLRAVRLMHIVRRQDPGAAIFQMGNVQDPRAACIVVSRQGLPKGREGESVLGESDRHRAEALPGSEVVNEGIGEEEDTISLMTISSRGDRTSTSTERPVEGQHKLPVVTVTDST